MLDVLLPAQKIITVIYKKVKMFHYVVAVTLYEKVGQQHFTTVSVSFVSETASHAIDVCFF